MSMLANVFAASPPADADSDLALVTAAQRDLAEFSPLYRRHVGPIYGYCARRLGNGAAAEDATSLIFAKAIAALPRFRPSRGTFRAWLFAIAHNVVIAEYRSARPAASLDVATGVPDQRAGPEELALRSERRDELVALLERLPPDQRDVIELRLLGLRGPEIARVLGRSHTAVKVAQFRAIQRLRAAVVDKGCHEGTTS